MFAGLPGIGVGTLFYILMALSMPVIEIRHVLQGTSSLARWRQIVRQWCFAFSIILSIVIAERVLMVIFAGDSPRSLSPARLLNQQLSTRAPQSILAAPMTASLLILAAVLAIIEIMRIVDGVRRQRQEEASAISGHPSALQTPSSEVN
jgi:hypothetical protein